ncbi:hypothetical protein [Cucumibacter marinus]|uniref:hypothetical protein n=1 Tax=Cucumibacter marinus TaxID=1121252 RepID=UPI00048E1A76|nr:hypothetical protein [Cucumibacter marinus]
MTMFTTTSRTSNTTLTRATAKTPFKPTVRAWLGAVTGTLAGAMLFAAPSMAQDAMAPDAMDQNFMAPTVELGVDATAAASGEANSSRMTSGADTYGDVIAEVQTNVGVTLNLDAFAEADEVDFVRLSELKADPDTATPTLDSVLEGNAEAIDRLQADVEASSALRAEIEEQDFSIEDVIAIDAATDGTLDVYVDDRA